MAPEPAATAVTPLRAVVSLDALRENLALLQRRLGAKTELIACVKANAYGHGLLTVARCLEAAGVRWLSLGSPAEALALRRGGVASDILLFPTGDGGDPAPLLEAAITVGIQSYAEAEALARVARSPRPASVFLKVDSGLGRVGVALEDAAGVAARIQRAATGVRLAGVFTHLPFGGADGAAWVQERLLAFGQVAAEIRAAAREPLVVQALASGGIACGLTAPGANAVCPGSLLYGIEPAWLSAPLGTRPALTEVRTALETVRSIASGTRYGYGGARVAARATRLGALPIGYSNSILVPKPGQRVRVAGGDAPVLSVSLEHTVVDLTDAGDARVGDPVRLLASEPSAGPTLAEVAAAQGRTPLEVLVSLTGRATYEYRGSGEARPAPTPS